MKVYTKTGDKGSTSLLGGTRVPKHHIRIEAYGTVDELNSYLGLLRDTYGDAALSEKLIAVQNDLFLIGSHLANDPEHSKFKLPELAEGKHKQLEQWIDEMNEELPEMRNFVLPGGHPLVSHCHIARCICRRAERCITQLAQETEMEAEILIYVNRLSDYLFVLSRWFSHRLQAVEIPWKP